MPERVSSPASSDFNYVRKAVEQGHNEISLSRHARERYRERVTLGKDYTKAVIRQQVREAAVVATRMETRKRGKKLREVRIFHLRHANGLHFVVDQYLDRLTLRTVYLWDKELKAITEEMAQIQSAAS